MEKQTQHHGKTMLAVLAHPDDETFGMGGTLALYAQRGVKVHLICATRGELGEIDPEYKETIKSASCLRTQELRCAADVLGIDQLHFLKYRDSGMPGADGNLHSKALAAQPIEKVAEEVAHLIRQIQPDVVITFDPIGGYRHPDHIAIQRATVRAFELVSDPDYDDPDGLAPFQPGKLYFHTINRGFLKATVWVLRLLGQDPHAFGRNKDIDLVSIANVDFPTHVKIDYRPVKDIRQKAAECHASQGGGEMNKGFRGFITRLLGGHHETFMQAYPELKPGEKVKRDLFE
ncbi:MAG TPA: PIG-L family deacetylase [Brevefilum sp.]